MKRIFSLLAIVVLTCGITGMAGAIEILKNGGFEMGLTDWVATGNVFAMGTWWEVSPTEGSSQAVMTFLGHLDSDLKQRFSVDPDLYTGATISFDYNLKAFDWSESVDPGSDYLSVAYDSNEILRVYLDDVFDPDYKPSEYGWHTFSGTYPASALVGPLTFHFHVENRPPGGGDPYQDLVAYVDEVSIDAHVSVPELPMATMNILMLATVLGYTRVRFRRRK